MNYEEMLNAQNGPTHREETLLGNFFRRQVDGKYRYFIELRTDLTDSIVFCEALKTEQQWALRKRSKQQFHYELWYEGKELKEIELESGSFQTLSSLLDQNPAMVAAKGFVDNLIKGLLDYTSSLHNEGVYHLCFSPSNIFMRKNENTPLLLSHGSFYKAMNDQKELFDGHEEYVAPEVLAGEQADQRSDVYSLGKLIAFLFSQGSMPYEYNQVVKKATAEDPNKRYKSVEAMRSAITQKRGTRRSLIMLVSAVVISLLVFFIYMDMLPESSGNIEFIEHPQQVENDLFSDEELVTDTAFLSLSDTTDISDEALMQKAEMIYRKRYQKAADEILSRVYNSEHMGSSEKTFMANSQSMAEELLSVQKQLAEEAGLPEGLAGRIGHEIVEKLTEQKQKNLQRNGYIRPEEE